MSKSYSELTDSKIRSKAQELLLQMSLEEKVNLLNGIWDPVSLLFRYRNAYNPVPIKTGGCTRLGIEPVAFSDGPRGIVMGRSTCFPVSMARGASFDTDLERRIGEAIGKEARAQGANLFAGVCINLLMHPAWGRAQETYGEDPFHVGEFGKALTMAVQSQKVMACIKHYALNNIENSRFYVDVDLSERTLREVYLPHFKKAVAAGAASVMGSYNKFRGEHACESGYLLTKILREEWGFEGFTMSDFLFGIRDGKKALEAGMDMEMPMPVEYGRKLVGKVESGELSEETVNTAALRVIRTMLQFRNDGERPGKERKTVACKEHIKLAREAAEKSMVLIRNENNTLPFGKNLKKLLVLGRLASEANTGDYGSSRVSPPYVVTPLKGLRRYLKGRAEVVYLSGNDLEKVSAAARAADAVVVVAGNDARDEGEHVVPDKGISFADVMAEGYRRQGQRIKAVASSAAMKLAAGDKAYTSRKGAVGGDRSRLSLRDEEIRLIETAGACNSKTAVVLVCGSMIMTNAWEKSAGAILYSWYAGMEGGNALARILFGDVNPSGKLPFAVPSDESHLHPFDRKAAHAYYDYYHGYRWLDRSGLKPALPFGFGLSYTSYEYSDLAVQIEDDCLKVCFRVRNTGDRGGEEVSQVYIGFKDSTVERHRKVLKGFSKTYIECGETVDSVIRVPLSELEYYDDKKRGWLFENGMYTVYAGPHSGEDALLRVDIEIQQRQ